MPSLRKLTGDDIRQALDKDGDLTYVDFRGVNLRSVANCSGSFHERDLTGSDFSNQDLTGYSLDYCNLESVNFSGANLMSTWFAGSNCSNANFTGAKGFYTHNKAIFHKANFTNAQFRRGTLNRSDFSQACFEGADLRHVTFYGANFQNAIFTNTKLTHTTFESSDLSGSQLFDMKITKIKFMESNLNKVIWKNVKLKEPTFTGCMGGPSDWVIEQFKSKQITFLEVVEYLRDNPSQYLDFYQAGILDETQANIFKTAVGG